MKKAKDRPPTPDRPNAFWWRIASATTAGTLVLLSFPPFGLGWLMWVALAPLFAIHRRLGRRSLLLYGYVLASVPIWTIAFAIAASSWPAFLAFASSVPLAFAVGIAGASALESRFESPLARLLVFPCCAVIVEFALGTERIGVPATIALTQANLPIVIQSADLFGTAATTFLLLLVNRTWPILFEDLRRRRVSAPVALTAVLFTLNLAYGWRSLTEPSGEPGFAVATVQPVISTADYVDRQLDATIQLRIDDTIERLIRQALRGDPDLLVLSEGGNGRYNFRLPAFRRRLEHTARRSGAGLLVSSLDLSPAGDEYNALFSLDRDGRLLGSYRKRLLTPIGEEHFTPGTDRAPLPSAIGPIGAMVCFESCFAGVARSLVQNGAEYLLVSTSDASFRNSPFPLLHSSFSIFRAIETRRYLIQAANTGPSMVVRPSGVVDGTTSFLDRVVFSGRVVPRTNRTFFVRMPWVAPLAAIAYVLLAPLTASVRATSPVRPTARSVRSPWRPRARLAGAGLGFAGWVAALAVASVHLATRGTSHDRGVVGNVAAFLAPPPVLDVRTATARYRQRDTNTCGPAALAYLLHVNGVEVVERDVIRRVSLDARGTTLLELAHAAEHFGFEARGELLNLEALRRERRPLIAYLANPGHFVVVLAVEKEWVFLFDPAWGPLKIAASEFVREWNGYTLQIRFMPSADLDGIAPAVLARQAALSPPHPESAPETGSRSRPPSTN